MYDRYLFFDHPNKKKKERKKKIKKKQECTCDRHAHASDVGGRDVVGKLQRVALQVLRVRLGQLVAGVRGDKVVVLAHAVGVDKQRRHQPPRAEDVEQLGHQRLVRRLKTKNNTP